MSSGKSNLPTITGYAWRPIQASDAPALADFELACSLVDGATHLLGQTGWAQRLADGEHAANHSLLAIDSQSNIAAVGWIDYRQEVHEVQAFLDGRIHPNFRRAGLGTALLSWLEDRASSHLASIAGERLVVLRILFYDHQQDALDLFQQHGFEFQFSEEQMVFDLQGPLPEFDAGIYLKFETWTQDNAPAFYQVYADSFSTRSRQLMDEAAWSHHFTNPLDGEFRPDLSLLARSNDEPVAFCVTTVETVPSQQAPIQAWINQMGVCRACRRQGIGAALLSEALHRVARAGYPALYLSVNIDNPQAAKLYLRLGFQLEKRFTLYRKELPADN